MGDNGFAELASGMTEAREAMRLAQCELNARQRLIEDYRRKNYAHEDMVGKLYELLKQDDLDGAMDIVREEYGAIHGPNE